MTRTIDRRQFLRITGASLGAGALYRVGPARAAGPEAAETARRQARASGEAVTPFTLVQLSDTHVGFSGPPRPGGVHPFERAVEVVNQLDPQPDLVLFTGDLTHDSEDAGERAARMKRFREIAGKLRVRRHHLVPGEHDAGLDGGTLFRESFGETCSSFDHKGVHFVGLDNVSRAKPEVGPERLAWLRDDLASYPSSAPIVVFTHRPLFDLKPEWEWFTRDGDQVMKLLAPFENVTVLYGHIHREDQRTEGKARHCAARSLIFAFPDPARAPAKKPIPFDASHPFANLGLRVLHVRPGQTAAPAALSLDEIELTLQERSGTEGLQQILRPSTL